MSVVTPWVHLTKSQHLFSSWHLATNNYLNQWWWRSVMPCGVTRPQWIASVSLVEYNAIQYTLHGCQPPPSCFPRLCHWPSPWSVIRAGSCSDINVSIQLLPAMSQGMDAMHHWGGPHCQDPSAFSIVFCAVGHAWGTTSVNFGSTYICFTPSTLPVFAVGPQYKHLLFYFCQKYHLKFEGQTQNLEKSVGLKTLMGFVGQILIKLVPSSIWDIL